MRKAALGGGRGIAPSLKLPGIACKPRQRAIASLEGPGCCPGQRGCTPLRHAPAALTGQELVGDRFPVIPVLQLLVIRGVVGGHLQGRKPPTAHWCWAARPEDAQPCRGPPAPSRQSLPGPRSAMAVSAAAEGLAHRVGAVVVDDGAAVHPLDDGGVAGGCMLAGRQAGWSAKRRSALQRLLRAGTLETRHGMGFAPSLRAMWLTALSRITKLLGSLLVMDTSLQGWGLQGVRGGVGCGLVCWGPMGGGRGLAAGQRSVPALSSIPPTPVAPRPLGLT